MTFGSLFAGIGGIDLGLERAGWEVRWQVEIDDFATRALEQHWPGVPRHRDVREVGAHNLERVDLVAGGFPCQDISVAGRGKGLDGERSGLWFEFLRIVQELRPAWVLAENVPALRTRGADVVIDGLAAAGYAAWPLVVGARHVGAPHRRDRVWIVAHRGGAGLGDAHGCDCDGRADIAQRGEEERVAAVRSGAGELADAERFGGERRRGAGDVVRAAGEAQGEGLQRERGGSAAGDSGADVADAGLAGLAGRRGLPVGAGAEEPVLAGGGACDVAHGHGHGHGRERERERIADGVGIEGAPGNEPHRRSGPRPCDWPARPGEPQHEWEEPRTVEPALGGAASRLSERLAGRHRRDSLKALGNSVVPQVVEQIGRAILEAAS